MNLKEQVNEIFLKFSEKVLLIDAASETQWTYRQFLDRTIIFMEMLQAQGINKDKKIAVILQNSVEFVNLYFASLFLGCTIIPVNPHLHPREIGYIIEQVNPSLVILDKNTHAIVEEIKIHMEKGSFNHLCINDEIEMIDSRMPDLSLQNQIPWERDNDSAFMIVFTSGTSGKPKGVVHNAEKLFCCAQMYGDTFGFNKDHRFIHIFSMSYMVGFLNLIVCPFVVGASVVISKLFDARMALEFWTVPKLYSVNIMWFVPTVITILLKMDMNVSGARYCRENIPHICVGTAPLPLKIKQDFESKYGTKLHESYGLSETLFVCSNTPEIEYRENSVGQLIKGVEISILSDQLYLCGNNEKGEIHIRSSYMMKGYLSQDGDPELNLIDGWFATGDVGYIDEDGFLYITDRKKDMIIRGGYNVSPRALEEVLLEHSNIENAAVVGIPDEIYGEEIIAAIVLNKNIDDTYLVQDIKKYCRKQLNLMSQPNRYFICDDFPKSSTGKIHKKKIIGMILSEKHKLL